MRPPLLGHALPILALLLAPLPLAAEECTTAVVSLRAVRPDRDDRELR